MDDTWGENGDLDAANPPDLHHLLESGARGVQAFCRPYAYATNGRLRHCNFSIGKGRFKLEVEVGGEGAYDGDDVPTLIFIPFIHFRQERSSLLPQLRHGSGHIVGDPLDTEDEWEQGNGPVRNAVDIDMSDGRFEMKGQVGCWYYNAAGRERTLSLVIRRVGGSLWTV